MRIFFRILAHIFISFLDCWKYYNFFRIIAKIRFFDAQTQFWWSYIYLWRIFKEFFLEIWTLIISYWKIIAFLFFPKRTFSFRTFTTYRNNLLQCPFFSLLSLLFFVKRPLLKEFFGNVGANINCSLCRKRKIVTYQWLILLDKNFSFF